MTTSLVQIVSKWSDLIKNGRTKYDVYKSVTSETQELYLEVLADLPDPPVERGDDGIFGECIDIIVSVLDLIRMERPDVTMAELEAECAAYAEKKCLKWAVKYGNHIPD